jgi:ABC-type polysaccharide/polyol phosphate transport system ATPase subunit
MTTHSQLPSTASALLSVPDAPRRERVIEVRGVTKSFRIPIQRVDTVKERVTSRFRRREFRPLQALRGVDFDVYAGEFFGIVGRNGSGKSTLLKLLASIYRADAGRIGLVGRIAPCIELGVGFNGELTAAENVVLNGVMMGLTPQEAAARIDDVIEFAELGDYSDLKLKNYSSGMLVRLGFSLMTQVDADVLLVDEVLAVGDASFQQKCFDAFARYHAAGKTIILVTHDMSAIESHCDRAILLHQGKVDVAGDPGDVARRYLELNFPEDRVVVEAENVDIAGEAGRARIVDVRLADDSGAAASSFGQSEPIRIEATIEADARLEDPTAAFQIVNGDGLLMFSSRAIDLSRDGVIEAGDRVSLRLRVENPLATGRYFVNLALGLHRAEDWRPVAFRKNAADFVVFGTRVFGGLFELGFKSETAERIDEEPV